MHSQVKTCIDLCSDPDDSIPPPEKKRKRIEWSADELADEYPSFVSVIPVSKPEELRRILSGNRNRFPDVEYPYSEVVKGSVDSDNENTIPSGHKQTTNSLINALCHPDVIAKVTELLLKANKAEEH